MKKLAFNVKSRRFYYLTALLLVLGVNANALIEPVYAKVEYAWSRQQSVVEQYGRWDTATYNSPVNSIHAALLHTGKVLLIAGSGNNRTSFDAHSFKSVVWNPADGSFKDIPTPWDAFCAGHAFLPDGKLLVAGGTKGYEDLTRTPRQEFQGLKDSYLFNPDTERYEKVSSMEFARWYPTLVGLGDGTVLAAAGLDDKGKKSSGEAEIYDPATGGWTHRTDLTHVFPTYPALLLTADGRLFYSGAHQGYEPGKDSLTPGFWDLKTNEFQTVTGLTAPEMVNNSSSVLLPPAQDQRVMIMGGAAAGDSPVATNRTAIIDLDGSTTPTYEAGPNLVNATRYPGIVVLPDDTVLETGGSTGYRRDNNFSAQIFHPDTNTFTPAATPRVGRNYHSEAILLPDGRVATFGSNPIDNTFEMRIEIYSPSYLFKGERPRITGGSTEMARGTNTSLIVAKPGEVKTAKLLRPSAVTHVTDVEQRSISLAFTKTATGLNFEVPSNPNLVPSGWYMAFVTNQQDVPSAAYWVHVP